MTDDDRRSGAPVIVTNPGSGDQISGYAWEHVTVRREDA